MVYFFFYAKLIINISLVYSCLYVFWLTHLPSRELKIIALFLNGLNSEIEYFHNNMNDV